jgi:hypothetical protein
MENTPLGPKDPEEIKVLKFAFARELAGASIALVTSVIPTVYKGADPNPGAVVLGAPVVSGTDVLQRMQGGLADVAYKWRAKVTDSNGNVHVVADWVLVQSL